MSQAVLINSKWSDFKMWR